MKKLMLALCALALGFGSCSEDFDVAAPYRQITVVYGILDVRNPAQYIRIQKAFMDESRSAIDMSQQPDSNYYQSLRVQMRELDSTGTNIFTTFPDLPRVDLNAEGLPKAAGDFFGAPSYAYKFSGTLNPARRYRLVITNTETGRVDSSETDVINPLQSAFEILQIDLVSDYRINFATTANNATYQLRFNRLPTTAKILEAVMRFHVINRNTVTGVETRDSFDFTFATADTTQVTFPPRLETANLSFYSFLSGALGDAPANVERYLDSPDVFIYAGSRELLSYSIFTNASGGLTGDQVRPSYTNISSSQPGDAIGLFAGRTVRAALEVPIAPIVIDSLSRNPLTDGLNIVGIYGK